MMTQPEERRLNVADWFLQKISDRISGANHFRRENLRFPSRPNYQSIQSGASIDAKNKIQVGWYHDCGKPAPREPFGGDLIASIWKKAFEQARLESTRGSRG